MKKTNKYLSAAAIATLTLGVLSSCDDKVEYTPASPEGGAQVYFSPNPKTQYQLSEDENTFSVTLYRVTDTDEVVVPIEVTPAETNTSNGSFTFPASVTFAAGEKEAQYTVGYDISDLEYDDNQVFTLTINPDDATTYGVQSITITAVYPSPWTYLGVGSYDDTFWSVNYDPNTGEYVPMPVDVYQNDLDENYYRISNPYILRNEEEDTYLYLHLLQEGEDFLEQTVDRSGLVYFEEFYVGFNTNYSSDMYLDFPGLFVDYNPVENWVYNKVVDYQDNGMPGQIQLAPMYYMDGIGAYDFHDDPTVTIVFPGYDVLDTDITVTFEGISANAGSVADVLANVQFSTDLTEVKVAIYFNDLSAAVIAEGIAEGALTSVSMTEPGQVKVPFDLSSPTDRYSIVAAGFVNGELRSWGYVNFSHYQKVSADENYGWESLGYVDYTDGFVCSRYMIPVETWSVEIQEYSSYPGYYRLVNPYGKDFPLNEEGEYATDFDTYIYLDASDPQAVILDYSKQTLNWGDGDLICYSFAAYYLDAGADYNYVESEGAFGYTEDNKIMFPWRNLLELWGGEGYYYANYAFDYDLFYEEGISDYLYNSNGEPVAPFCVDLGSLSDKPTRAISPLATRSFAVKRNMAKDFKNNFFKDRKLPLKKKFKKLSSDVQKIEKSK